MQFDQDSDKSMYLGGGTTQTMPVSEKTTLIIDEEISEIINSCYAKATKLLEENRDILEAMKDALLKYETLDAMQIDDLMARRPCRPPTLSETIKNDENKSSDNNGQETKKEDGEKVEGSDGAQKEPTEQKDDAQNTSKEENIQATDDSAKISEDNDKK